MQIFIVDKKCRPIINFPRKNDIDPNSIGLSRVCKDTSKSINNQYTKNRPRNLIDQVFTIAEVIVPSVLTCSAAGIMIYYLTQDSVVVFIMSLWLLPPILIASYNRITIR